MWLSLLPENLQLAIIFIAEIWMTYSSEILSTCADFVNCIIVPRKIEYISKNSYPVKCKAL